MKTLVIYDSKFGNTQKVAEAVAKVMGGEAKRVGGVKQEDWQKVDLLVVGSPVHGGRPTEEMQKWLQRLSREALKGKKAAVFDTRFEEKEQNWALKLLMRMIGYAAEKMAKMMRSKGAELVAEPEGFIVTDKEGPLKKGELERVGEWAEGLTE